MPVMCWPSRLMPAAVMMDTPDAESERTHSMQHKRVRDEVLPIMSKHSGLFRVPATPEGNGKCLPC